MWLMTRMATFFILAIIFTTSIASAQQGVRVKDVSSMAGIEEIQVFGYGLVVGLANTGDRNQTIFTTQTVQNMLKNMGIELPNKNMRVRNVAAVMVTGTLAPFKRSGTHFDVTVSSLGDARSLEGGMLILTPLQGPGGTIYGSAQGPLATGGYNVTNRGLGQLKKNHVLVGRIPDGAIVQKEYKLNVLDGRDLSIALYQPDFSSAFKMANAINEHFSKTYKETIARPVDASTVLLDYNVVARDSIRNYVGIVNFISQVENVRFDIEIEAKVVMNERTGTIVAGGNVTISEIAVTHGGVKVEIINIPEVVYPKPFTFASAEVIPNPQMLIEEKDMEMVVLEGTTTVSDLSQALNSLGVTSRDIISIFQAIKEAGALQGKLIVM